MLAEEIGCRWVLRWLKDSGVAGSGKKDSRRMIDEEDVQRAGEDDDWEGYEVELRFVRGAQRQRLLHLVSGVRRAPVGGGKESLQCSEIGAVNPDECERRNPGRGAGVEA